MTVLNESFELANGVRIPKIGFGTWQIPNGRMAYDAVACALATGYRHVDTAHSYRNEASVGQAVRDAGIPRAEIFVTSKLPAEIKSLDAALKSFEQTMAALGLDYLDLYLIHAPWPWHEVGTDYRTDRPGVRPHPTADLHPLRAAERRPAAAKVHASGIHPPERRHRF